MVSSITPYESLLTSSAVANIKYTLNNQNITVAIPIVNDILTDNLDLEKRTHILDKDRFELEYVVTAKERIILRTLEFESDMNLKGHVMLAEGFQCWSTVKEMGHLNRLLPIPRAVSWITKFNLQGDYDFFEYSGQYGKLHATAYTYLRHTSSDKIVFIGSVSEHSGYTYYKTDLNGNRFSLYKDIDGKLLNKGDVLSIKLLIYQIDKTADLSAVWSKYAEYYDPTHAFQSPRHLTGWSSWYNFYERVTEADVLASLNAFKEHGYPIDVFQIDDGYQQQIGDWLDVDIHKFPRGMKVLADDIKEHKMMPGLWIAPYAVGFKSKIVKQHPDWLLKYPNSTQPLVAGPNWGGFYALDIYHPEVKAYLQTVFDHILDVWGYRLLKLDFLFAAAMVPRLGKSRGEIMWDATDLIVELTHKRALILGSGVPLASIWGKFEYNRVSSDASPWWDHTVLRLAHVRERVSTLNAITSSLNRWPMGSRMFGSDPDVFFIRSDKNKLTVDEKYTLLLINLVFGQLTLMSDNVNLYSQKEHDLYASTFPKPEASVIDLTSVGVDVYQATYACNQREYIFLTNLSPLPFTGQLPLDGNGKHTYYFEHSNVLVQNKVDWLKSQSPIFLKPHETRMFMKVNSSSSSRDFFMGSTGNIVPGAEIDSIVSQDGIRVTLREPFMKNKKRKLYIRLDSSEVPNVYVNNELITKTKKYIWNEDITVVRVLLH
ncbi:hypothetical protein RMATCC62417_08891 [Rhizopus microsporus]|nr:hypothetical protein RMATCC62417_08891 [Rhizopus microsporus]